MPSYLQNLSSDAKSSFSNRKMYKSLRDSPSYKETGYRFLYNLGTVSSLGVKVPGRSQMYQGMQFSNDVSAFTNTTRQSKSLIRRGLYKAAAFGYGRLLGNLTPNLGGIGGRYARVAIGKFSSARLRRFDQNVRDKLYTEFHIDAKKIDNYVKSQTSQVGIDLAKIQRGMQAIAISNAPDPYAVHRFNRTDSRNSIDRLGKEEQLMSSFSLSTFDEDNIDALLSRKDIVDIMGSDALNGAPASKLMYENSSDAYSNGRIMESLYSQGMGGNASFDRDKSSTLSEGEAKRLADFAVGEFGIGAEYAFGSTAKGPEVATKAREFIAEQLLLTDKYNNEGFFGPVPSYEAVAFASAGRLQEILDASGEEGLKVLGEGRQIMRYLHGDDAGYTGGSNYNSKNRYKDATLDVYQKKEERFNERVTRNIEVSINESQSTSFVMPNRKENVATHKDRFGSEVFEELPVQGPNTRRIIPTGKTKLEKRIELIRSTRAVAGDKVGDLKYIKDMGQKNRNTINNRKIHSDGVLEQTFSDNPARNNFVPNRRQIQSAIHSLDPDYTKKNSTVELSVGFGGKSPKSTRPDSIRDAYQIEYGGPATDRNRRLSDRTDAFVYTPSLFMYRSAVGAAKAFGLGVSSGKNVVGHIKGNIRGGSDGEESATLSDVFVKSRGLVEPNKTQKKILDEIYEYSAKANNSPIFEGGQLMLSKNRVLASAFDDKPLELVSDMLNRNMFGGASTLDEVLGKGSKFNKANDYKGFERVINPEDSLLNQEKAIHRAQKELGIARQPMASGEFIDENIIGMELDSASKVPLGLEYEEFFDENTDSIKYRITGRQFDDNDLAVTEEGKVFIPGQLINARTKQGVTDSSSAFNYETPGVKDDVNLLRDVEQFGEPGSAAFTAGTMKSKIGRNLQFQEIHSRISRQFRGLLGQYYSPEETTDFANRLTNNIMKSIADSNRRGYGGKVKYARGATKDLLPDEVNLISEFFGAQFDELHKVLKANSFQTRRFNRRITKSSMEVTRDIEGSRVKGLRDASLGRAGMSFLYDEGSKDEIITIFNDSAKYIEDAIAGNMSVQDAITLGARKSARDLNRLQSKIKNPITDVISDVSGTKSSRVISNTNLTPTGRSGDSPSVLNQSVSSIDKKTTSDEMMFGLRGRNGRAQLKYVQFELNRIRTSTRVNTSIDHIVRKCSNSPFILSAWKYYIAQDMTTRNSGMNDGTVNAVREFLERFFTENG